MLVLAAVLLLTSPLRAGTREEWIAPGARVHGGFDAFIPIGVGSSSSIRNAPSPVTLISMPAGQGGRLPHQASR